MKKVICLLVLVSFFLMACGTDMVIDGKKHETIGIISLALDKKVPGVKYEVIWGNVILGVLLIETIIAPIYFFGFSMFEPVGKEAQ